jgi:hypothetical protein
MGMHSTVAGWTLALDRKASAHGPLPLFRLAATATHRLRSQVAESAPVRFGAARVKNPTPLTHDAAGGGAHLAPRPAPQTLNPARLFLFDAD